jgi:dienelactone hydrolase
MTGVFSPRLIDPRAIAVSGQSDGGETALAVAFLDRRVRAAVILSGAQIPHTGPLRFAERSSPMLATQGTGDVVNPPNLTDALFGRARRPKISPDADRRAASGSVHDPAAAARDRRAGHDRLSTAT